MVSVYGGGRGIGGRCDFQHKLAEGHSSCNTHIHSQMHLRLFHVVSKRCFFTPQGLEMLSGCDQSRGQTTCVASKDLADAVVWGISVLASDDTGAQKLSFSLKLEPALSWQQVSEAWPLKNGICSRAARALPSTLSNRGSFSIGMYGLVDHETPWSSSWLMFHLANGKTRSRNRASSPAENDNNSSSSNNNKAWT